ncbi:hypothetical protein PVAND_006402 [Polypedilum vanderplanki]|uniref:Cystatin domain-containing protein n=1 Tax=Polypedilum vanderplanki TaxID=319348 RepID=A0A9J6C432_POLVA|nr:hypothetical protein PVAND_006402 [Polypedilum vanderplanki]
MTGGVSSINIDDETVIKLLEENLVELDTGDDFTTFTVVNITKITRQVVSGILYKIFGDFKAGNEEAESCIVTIFLQPCNKEECEKPKIKADCSQKTYRMKTDFSDW